MINYNIPAVRVARRVLIAMLGASLAVLLTKVNLAPDQLIDSLLALSRADWMYIAKVGGGTGILLGIDKTKRELGL